MADYLVRFSVHLIPALKPDGWSNPIFHDAGPFRAHSFDDLKTLIDKYILMVVRQNGVIILKDSKKSLQENVETMDLRVFVPMTIIQYIEQSTIKLVSDVPDIGDETVWIN